MRRAEPGLSAGGPQHESSPLFARFGKGRVTIVMLVVAARIVVIAQRRFCDSLTSFVEELLLSDESGG